MLRPAHCRQITEAVERAEKAAFEVGDLETLSDESNDAVEKISRSAHSAVAQMDAIDQAVDSSLQLRETVTEASKTMRQIWKQRRVRSEPV